MFKIKKIKTMQFLAKNLTIFILMSGLYACTKEPINTPVAVYCNLINEKLYSFSRLSDFEKKKFDELKKSRFLKFKGDFVEAAQTFDIEWELLAAVAFQESQWNPKARSATQVKGMMMLTLPTAASVGVTNRLDPIQSIYGGAQYLSDLEASTNFGTSSGDKIAFVLASYNLGTTNVKNAIDAINCPISIIVTITEETLIAMTCGEVSPPTTVGGTDGVGQVDLSGGVAPYSIAWDGGSLNNLPAGITQIPDLVCGQYTVTVTDANNCETACDFTINCAGCDLSISETTGKATEKSEILLLEDRRRLLLEDVKNTYTIQEKIKWRQRTNSKCRHVVETSEIEDLLEEIWLENL